MPNSTKSGTELMQVQATQPTHLHRIAGIDAIAARKVLLITFLAVEPDQTQRHAFSSLLPEIYMLRNKDGYTFKKITKLLRDCGIKLAEPSVRVYYYQMLPSRKNECIVKMQEQALLWSEIKKETNGMEISAIAGKVAEILERNRVSDFG